MAEQQPLVLLVDDEEDLCLLMQMTLARRGIKTHLAYRVEQAKQLFTQFHYDACLTDLNLPDGSGIDLVKHVSQNYPNTPIAVLTAYGNMDIAIAALKAGAGKEVVANLVHRLSNRSEGPFIAINCGAIPTELMESELFGHKKGSFTGATQDKQGLILSAHGGSLFLDEIAELPLSMQVKLLRAVQEKKIRPVGSDQEIDVDFRVISASHQDLDLLVRQGKFRQDLFFRIHVMDLILPPLRERGEDVLLLANHFIQKICMEWETPPKQLTEAAETYLLQQHFPGNVRELRNMIERAITLSEDTTIDVSHLHPAPLRANISNPFASVAQSIQTTVAAPQVVKKLPSEGLERYLENIEKDILLNALNMTHWNRTLAAKKLGMTFRSLRYRLKKFGLDTKTEQEV